MRSRLSALPYLAIFAAAAALPFAGDDYVVLIATRAAVYWVLVSGLNLVVGFAGQLAIGWVSLLTIGAYTSAVVVARGWLGPIPSAHSRGPCGRGRGRDRRPARAQAPNLLFRDGDPRLRDDRDPSGACVDDM